MKLPRSKLLDQEQKFIFYETEISTLVIKITSLVEQMPLDFPNRAEISKKDRSKEKEIRGRSNLFKSELIDELKERNISKERLASSPNLNIKI